MTAGAASIYSTPADMARYLSALLGAGSGEQGTVLQATMATMFEFSQTGPAPFRAISRIPL